MGTNDLRNDWREIMDGTGLSGVRGLYGIVHRDSGRTLVRAATDTAKRISDDRRWLRTEPMRFPQELRADLDQDGHAAFHFFFIERCWLGSLLNPLKQGVIDQLGGLAYNARPAVSTKRRALAAEVSLDPPPEPSRPTTEAKQHAIKRLLASLDEETGSSKDISGREARVDAVVKRHGNLLQRLQETETVFRLRSKDGRRGRGVGSF